MQAKECIAKVRRDWDIITSFSEMNTHGAVCKTPCCVQKLERGETASSIPSHEYYIALQP